MAIVYNNTDGAIGLADGGTPRTLTIKAGENISGGYWVTASGLAGVVGSSASTYSAGDIEGYTVKTQVGSHAIGLALVDIASGTYGTIAMRGVYLLPALSGTKIGSVFAGQGVLAGSGGTVLPHTSGTGIPLPSAAGTKLYPVGRALTSAASATSEFVMVSLNL